MSTTLMCFIDILLGSYHVIVELKYCTTYVDLWYKRKHLVGFLNIQWINKSYYLGGNHRMLMYIT